MMEDSGSILCESPALKDMLDQVNEELEANIQRPREIESEVVKCSEVENKLLDREAELTHLINSKKFEMSGLAAVSAVASASLKHMEEEVMCLTSKREKMLNKITNDRQWLKFLKWRPSLIVAENSRII
ncbi:uncharacterized protein LOC18428759 isoform X2 [Amborella trichopoda]|uniref:uncharacterized protein LOC18428759 isoform X2 n=1 Tax=Amborella trichopoda TaxID=13333 RepID=UPI0009BD3293|nr:uncharacterized protein LOC18428759 isoform X2 [Amborella trichopoda]|eukprot:XP_020519580.1 uncharacterized protein LOC18428759 isoform X2 [Amborella trichopoda]